MVRHRFLGRDVRAGELADQAGSTFDLIEVAVGLGAHRRAAELARYLLVEMAEPAELYPVFHEKARLYLLAAGLPEGTLEAEKHRLAEANGAAVGELDVGESWSRFVSAVERFAAACDQGRSAPVAELEAELVRWRQAHDHACDLVQLYLALCARELGEARIEEMWDELLSELYATRDRYDLRTRPWHESFEAAVLDTCETFRGHLSGPGRRGTIEIVDDADRVAISFTPCGTGGRSFISEEGSPRFGVTTGAHRWSWGRAGVCLYCVHCCQLQERVPIRRFGYPVRVVEPPVWPASQGAGRCTWYVYKDPSLVPAEVYERLGESKPANLDRGEIV